MVGLVRAASVLLALALWACTGGASPGAGGPKRKRRPRRPAQETTRTGCGDARLLPAPTDLGARGPFAVGLRTVSAGGVTADVYYPAAPGSDAGAPAVGFDLRDHLPTAEALRLHGATLPTIPCACARDLPIDAEHGPYPLVYFFHGRGLTRAEFPTLFTHLASRGFVVVTPNLPGVSLKSYIEAEGSPDRVRAMRALIAAVAAPQGELEFLTGRLDTRVGLVGHSLGAGVVQELIDDHGDVAVVMGARGLNTRRRVPVLVMGGTSDIFAPYAGQVEGYLRSRPPKRLIGVRGAGHMQFADHCVVSPEFGGWYGAAVAFGLPWSGFLLKLAERGCADVEISAEQAHSVILAAVTGELEETLTCSPSAADELYDLGDRSLVAEYAEDLGGPPRAE